MLRKAETLVLSILTEYGFLWLMTAYESVTFWNP